MTKYIESPPVSEDIISGQQGHNVRPGHFSTEKKPPVRHLRQPQAVSVLICFFTSSIIIMMMIYK
ncbi:MAG: hypothetical protein IJW77_11995 [Clostridia bacterium]|nr:hypothetical protein [Clostridia bacterium]